MSTTVGTAQSFLFLVDAVIADLARFRSSLPQQDDITMVILKAKSSAYLPK
jgi:serine phosphatase RsbU (regulator of sigma subunit)